MLHFLGLNNNSKDLKDDTKRIKPKYAVGDKVRITVKKKKFQKGFTQNWTDKIYTITKVLTTLPPTYKIRDDKEEIEGSFYQQELQKTNQDTFRIEKVLRYKKKPDGTRLARVKWVGYNNTYNSWIPESEIIDYGNH